MPNEMTWVYVVSMCFIKLIKSDWFNNHVERLAILINGKIVLKSIPFLKFIIVIEKTLQAIYYNPCKSSQKPIMSNSTFAS